MPTVKWRRAYIRLSRLDKRYWLKEKFQQVKRRLRPRAPGVEVIELEDEVAEEEVEVLEEEVEVLEDEEEVTVEEEELVVELDGVAVTEAVEEKVEVVNQSKVRKRKYNQPYQESLDLEDEEMEDEVEMIVQSKVRKKKYDQAFSKHPVLEDEDREVIFQPRDRESRRRRDRSGKSKVKKGRGPEIVTLEEDGTEEEAEVEYVEEVKRGRRKVGAREQGVWAREARFQPRVNLLGLLNTLVRRQGVEDRLGGWQEIGQEEVIVEDDQITIDEDSWTSGLLAQEEEITVDDEEDDILLMSLPPDSSQLGLNQWTQPHVRDLTGEMDRAAGDGRGRTRWRQEVQEELNVMDFLAIDIVEEVTGQDVEVVEVEEDSRLVQEEEEKDLEKDGKEDQEEEMVEESRVESVGARASGKRSRRELKPRYRVGA